MTKLCVCFAGLGSIAKRHIRNLQSIAKEDGFDVEIDVYRHSLASGVSSEVSDVNFVFDVASLRRHYDAIFITNPTELHLDSIKMFSSFSENFFVEKPLCSVGQIDNWGNYKYNDDAVYYVASPLRYNPVITYIKENIKPDDVISVRSISSSYLPDWRPGTDYRNTYSAHKSLGGGVSIDLIHEWDYLSFLFGFPKTVKSMMGKKSNLEIDSEDYAIYLAEYENMMCELHLDYFGRKRFREIMLITKEDTIIGDLVNNSIRFLVSGEQIDFNVVRDDYQKKELRHFLDMVNGVATSDNDIEHALKVLKLTQGICE